jgi:DNA-binding PadR family transcriptional regulator
MPQPRSGVTDPGLLILISLAAGPKHGHAMMRDVERFAGVRMGPGTLYGALTRLDEDGLVEPMAPEGRRRPYRLTHSGMASLRDRLQGIERAVSVGLQRMAGT